MPITAGTSSDLPGPVYSVAPSSTARLTACLASTTRHAIAGAQGPCASMKPAAWLPGSAFSR
jgi:hypothetical protein